MSKAKRGNLHKSDSDHEIAAVILFLRNDGALFLLKCAQYLKDQQILSILNILSFIFLTYITHL
jgi:hypothetical protein